MKEIKIPFSLTEYQKGGYESAMDIVLGNPYVALFDIHL